MSDLHSIKILSKQGNKVQIQVTIVHPDEHYAITSVNFALQLILIFYEDIVEGRIYNSGWQYFPFSQEEGNQLILPEYKSILDELLLKMRWREIVVSKEEYEERQAKNNWTYQGERITSMGLYNGAYSLSLETEHDAFCELADEHIELVELLEVQHFPHWFDRLETHLAYEKIDYYFGDDAYDAYEYEPNPSYILQITVKHPFLLHHLRVGSLRHSAQYDFLHYVKDYKSTKAPILRTLMYSSEVVPPADNILLDWWNSLEKEWQLAFLMNLYIQRNWLFPQINSHFWGMIFKPRFEDVFGNEFAEELKNKTPEIYELRQMSQLKIMYTGGFSFKDLEPLRILKDLKLFYSEGTPLTNVEALGEMRNLEDLSLVVYGEKPAVTCLKNLTKLRKLYFDANTPEELEVILKMPDLKELQVMTPFEVNPELLLQCPKLKKLVVYDTSDELRVGEAMEALIAQLRAKGIDVNWTTDFASGLTYEY